MYPNGCHERRFSPNFLSSQYLVVFENKSKKCLERAFIPQRQTSKLGSFWIKFWMILVLSGFLVSQKFLWSKIWVGGGCGRPKIFRPGEKTLKRIPQKIFMTIGLLDPIGWKIYCGRIGVLGYFPIVKRRIWWRYIWHEIHFINKYQHFYLLIRILKLQVIASMCKFPREKPQKIKKSVISKNPKFFETPGKKKGAVRREDFQIFRSLKEICPKSALWDLFSPHHKMRCRARSIV